MIDIKSYMKQNTRQPTFSQSSSILFISGFPSLVCITHERVLLRLAVRTSKPIPNCDVLAIIIVEVQVVHCVACRAVDNLGRRKILGVIFTKLENRHHRSRKVTGHSRISRVHTVTKTKSPKYATFCNGKRKGKIWYGRPCDHPSRGWNA